MGAALRLRLVEAWRRGGGASLAVACPLVGLLALVGSDTAAGRYGLATDLASLGAYLAAVVLGAFPLALDRERHRARLARASPVGPWTWALGNAAGAAAAAGLFGLLLFSSAAAGAALGGGIETHVVTRIGDLGTIPLDRCPPIRVPPGATHLRLVAATYARHEAVLGSAGDAGISVDGKVYAVHHLRPVVVPIASERVQLKNANPDFKVGLVTREVRALAEPRSFLANALLAGLPPALAAAALAALGAAAGACLRAPVAALATALVLVLSGMKGFLIETIESEGAIRAEAEHAGTEAHTHRPAARHVAPPAVRGAVRGLLRVLPDLAKLDRTGPVARGDWTGARGAGRSLLLLAGALAAATLFGGLGLTLRRTPE